MSPANGGIFLEVVESSPADPIRDIHVWMPGFENHESSFHPLFLERIGPFGVIRFMDWQRTNGNQVVDWSRRSKPTDCRYSTKRGVPVERLVDLANELQSHPWFCIPHQASDDYVLQFAKLVKQRLDPRLRVYLEYSNEVWNTTFPQAAFAREMGRKLKLSDNDFQAQLFFYSRRSVEVFKIWKSVFRRKNRLIRVMASQSANPWVSEQVLSHGSAYRHVDALAIAPYFRK